MFFYFCRTRLFKQSIRLILRDLRKRRSRRPWRRRSRIRRVCSHCFESCKTSTAKDRWWCKPTELELFVLDRLMNMGEAIMDFADVAGVTRRAALAGLASAGAVSCLILPSAATPARRFGVVIPDGRRRFYERMLGGMNEAAKSLGIELKIAEYSFDLVREGVMAKQLLDLGLDGYLFVALRQNDPQLMKIVTTLAGSRTRTAAVDRRIPGADVTVLPDLAAAGAI